MSTNNETASTIEAMVNASSASPHRVGGQTMPNMQLDNDGNVSIIGMPPPETALVVPEHYSAAGQIEAMSNEIARIEADLTEGVFDSKGVRTGDRHTGRDRDLRVTQLASLKASAIYQAQRGLALAAQTAANAGARERTEREQAAAFDFHQGNPERAALLQREVAAAEARRVAEQIVKGRRGA